MKKLIAFDLDGTITQPKSPLTEKNRLVLDALTARYKLLMVSARQCLRVFNQLGQYPIDILGNYGMQYGVYDHEAKDLRILRNDSVPCDRESVRARIDMLRREFGFSEYKGDSVLYHPSGCVTFPIIGTEADLADKLSFDPDRSKRRKIYDRVASVFSEYVVFVGGTSSFDMAPKPFNKYYALDLYCREHGYSHGEVTFVGDDYGIGGNDESVYRSDIDFICVDNYEKFGEYVSPLLQ